MINWHGLNVNPGADSPSLEPLGISSYENSSDKLVQAPYSAHNLYVWEDNLTDRHTLDINVYGHRDW